MLKSKKNNNKNLAIGNYFAIVAITPGVIAVIVYEAVECFYYKVILGGQAYNPLVGIGMLVPMTLAMELFMFFISAHLARKSEKLADALEDVAEGDYSTRIDEKNMDPYVGLVRDFNKMADQLASVETLRKEFIGDFSHEFKTPIASINGFANLLLDESADMSEEEKREYLTIIANESSRLTNMAQQTMLMSRLDTQVTVTKTETFSLDEQIKQDIILLSDSWNEKNIEMEIELEPYQYTGDPELTSHIWINLLNNAIKFTPNGGTITVILRKREGGCMVTVRDSGIGMTAEACTRIFERYYQADASRASKGLGLGLSIVQRVIELCEGSIEVISKPGEGTSFVVKL